MALRPKISGFSLRKMWAHIGCADAEVGQRIAGSLEEEGEEWLHDIVMGEVPPGSLDVEDDAVIEAVVELAFFEQDHHHVGSNIWNSYFMDWAWERQGLLHAEGYEDADRAHTLIGWALLERPIFGTKLDTSWTSYGYLTHEELGELIGYLDQHPRLLLDEHGFGTKFIDWLREIHGLGLDYWFHSA
ncbi:hypothetical protein ACFCZY_39545 [Streptomyces sp. NPDC056237]|uniref:hypothetical protein n=1 Tax=unclassified Streptomyces TaxID=2593676 RepID=UPI0035D5FFF5